MSLSALTPSDETTYGCARLSMVRCPVVHISQAAVMDETCNSNHVQIKVPVIVVLPFAATRLVFRCPLKPGSLWKALGPSCLTTVQRIFFFINTFIFYTLGARRRYY